MRLTNEELVTISERAEKASSGPWRVATTTDGEYILDSDDCVVAATFERKEDAYFVANAREDIPRLVAEVERLREGLLLIAERYYEYDSTEQMAGVAEFYLKVGDNE